MIRSKIDWHFFVALLTLVAMQLCCLEAAQAQSPVPPKQDNDPQTVVRGCHEVEEDYHLRCPGHAKEYVNRCWQGLEKNDLMPVQDMNVKIEFKSTGQPVAEIPPGPLLHKKAKAPQSGDKYAGFNPATERPQYWGLEVPCGAPTGWVYPPLKPSGTEDVPEQTGPGPFVKQHAKNCKGGEGGAITCAPPSPIFVPKCYKQNALFNRNKQNLSKEGDQSIWEYELTTFGVGPISDTQYQMIERENNQRFIELLFDPERWMWTSKAATANQQQQLGNNLGHNADHATFKAYDSISEYLINVANENAATPTSSSAAHKKQSEVIWMVQQMYKQVYIPMAILLLLPGACMTQMKTMVQFGVLKMQDETTDTNNPFMGIIRSIIAVFLIPATQLIVSYMIDMGNSLHYETKKYVKLDVLKKYTGEQHPDPKISMSTNTVEPSNIDDEGRAKKKQADKEETPGSYELKETEQDPLQEQKGKPANGAEKNQRPEKEAQLGQGMKNFLNFMNYCLGGALQILVAFQLVMMCYLFLMGPIAGALYAWPNINKGDPGLFNKVFANWLDAVVVLALWRFWWMVVLVTMTTYIEWSQELGFFDVSSEWEQLVLTSFQVLLGYVPFQPFNFNPKPMVEKIIDSSKQGKNPGTGMDNPKPGGPGGGTPAPGGGTPAPGGTTPGGATTTPAPGGSGGGAPGGGRGSGSPAAPAASSAPPMVPAPSTGGGTGGGTGNKPGSTATPQAASATGVRTPMSTVVAAVPPPPTQGGGAAPPAKPGAPAPAPPPSKKNDSK